MKEAFDQLLRFLQQGIAAIFKFVELIWSWAATQVQSLASVPWAQWPLWKQIVLLLVLAGVAFALLKVVAEIWKAGAHILAAFATLLGVFVRTLPNVAVAGVLALAGLWVLNNLDLSRVKLPFWQSSPVQSSSLDDREATVRR